MTIDSTEAFPAECCRFFIWETCVYHEVISIILTDSNFNYRNHATNAYMLHALGITHVVSVGECALVPPENVATDESSSGYQFIAGKGPKGEGSLWIEEREGRIKVLDIKVCHQSFSIILIIDHMIFFTYYSICIGRVRRRY